MKTTSNKFVEEELVKNIDLFLSDIFKALDNNSRNIEIAKQYWNDKQYATLNEQYYQLAEQLKDCYKAVENYRNILVERLKEMYGD